MRGYQNVRVCRHSISGPFDAQAKVVSPPKKCILKSTQNGCPCFGTLSRLTRALKVALLGFPKNALRKSRKLTCFASQKYAEFGGTFLTPKNGVSRWILTVKICKQREYMGPKMAGQPCAQKRSSQRAVSCAMDLQSGREAPTK